MKQLQRNAVIASGKLLDPIARNNFYNILLLPRCELLPDDVFAAAIIDAMRAAIRMAGMADGATR